MDDSSFSSASGLGFPSTSPPPNPSLSLDLETYSHGYMNYSRILRQYHQVAEGTIEPFPVGLVAVPVPVPAGDGGGGRDESKIREEKSTGKTATKKVRKPRYAFQTRSQVDILDDGYRWRKYGQKAVKNNNFPRNYYRCTYQGCIVKKQVQRLNKDEGVVVTTYEGIHSHPIQSPNDNFEHILNQMHIVTNSSLLPMPPPAAATN